MMAVDFSTVEQQAGSRFIIRRANPLDVDAILCLADSSSMVAKWDRRAYEEYCGAGGQSFDSGRAHALFVAATAGASRDGLISERILGFAAWSSLQLAIGAECELENMAVEAASRRKNIGRRLLTAGIQWCRSQGGSAVRLEVRASNVAALELYRSAGFWATGTRRSYYAGPQEDAVAMCLDIRQGTPGYRRGC